MSVPRTRLALLVGLLLLALCPAAGPPPYPVPSEVARWIEELGDDGFAVRESAMRKLRLAGRHAEPALEQAMSSKDAEVVGRAGTILDEFRWGIYPDTPADILELIRKYQSSARTEKKAVLDLLLAAGTPGAKAVIKIARSETNPDVRKQVFGRFTETVSQNSAGMLADGKTTALESMLELAVSGDPTRGMPSYLAYHLLTGQLSARIAEWENRARSVVVPKAENEMLAFLYRARGDLARAIKAATEAELGPVLEGFLYEQANWRELATRPELVSWTFEPSKLSYRLAFHRLNGDVKQTEVLLKDLVERADPIARTRGDVLQFAKGLFLNGQGGQGVDLLARGNFSRKRIYEIYAARHDFAKAFDIVASARAEGSPEVAVLEILQARSQHLLGEKEKALATLGKYASRLGELGSVDWVIELVDSENRIGRRDEAFAHAARVLSNPTDPSLAGKLFEKLYDAPLWHDVRDLWTVLVRVYPTEPKPALMARLRSLMDGKATAKDIEPLLKDVDARYHTPLAEDLANAWRLVGDAALLCKQPGLAEQAFRKSSAMRAQVRLGDLLAEKKQWLPAAAQYYAAYVRGLKLDMGRNRDDEGESLPALALFLSGHALRQAGQELEGKRRIDLAHLLPMGDVEMRFDLSRALTRRKHLEGARREQEVLRRIGDPVLTQPDNYFTGEGLRGAGLEASRRKDWLTAADAFEQTFLRCLHPDMNFSKASAYVLVPAYMYHLRARGLIEAKKYDLARLEIDRVKACVPGHMDTALHLVPELDRQGRSKDGDQLHREIAAPYQKLVETYPKSSYALNQVGWLAACCRRDMDAGLIAIRKALALSPDVAAYHDTHAELLFQMGKKEEALAAVKKALALTPDRAYFKKQLKRIEAGDPKTPRPDNEEE